MNHVGEPFADDRRVAKAERAVRAALPDLPAEAEFATYVQPRTWHDVDGIHREIPPTAVFIVKSKNPRNESFDLIDRGSELLTNWLMRDRAFMRYVGMVDPLVPLFMQVASAHVHKIRNLREMN